MSQIIHELKKVKDSSRYLAEINDEQINQVLNTLADLLDNNVEEIIRYNRLDLDKMDKSDPRFDRLLLDEQRINSIAADVRRVSKLDSPLNKKISEKILPNGLQLLKKSVALGVVAVIYEARPNVTIDVFSLCFKSGNAVVLKGGSDAWESNQILTKLIIQSLQSHNISTNIIYLMPPEREFVDELLNAVGFIDVCIPRGSQKLIEYVREHAKIPVIETGAGIVHTYFDITGDVLIADKIVNNAKTRRVSVCNALDCLLIHSGRRNDIPQLVKLLADRQVIIYADDESYAILQGNYPADLLCHAVEESFGCEFLDYKLAVKIVSDIDVAIAHILKFTSGHSEAIISEDIANIEKFINQVDAAVIYINASTAFTDGGEFGMGAEIGISTQKLHARGPMALPELTSYKWIVTGHGQIR